MSKWFKRLFKRKQRWEDRTLCSQCGHVGGFNARVPCPVCKTDPMGKGDGPHRTVRARLVRDGWLANHWELADD